MLLFSEKPSIWLFPVCCKNTAASISEIYDLGAPSSIREANSGAFQRNACQRRAPLFSCLNRKGARKRSGRHDFARCEHRTEPVPFQRLHKMTQSKKRPIEDVGRGAVIDPRAVPEKVDLEAREFVRPPSRRAAAE